jgi:formylglycine-generating enzyme required for sulfatase activity
VSITDQGGREILLYEESYALVVGAGDYRAGWPRLYNVHDEVQRVARALESQGFRVVTLLDPTGDELRDAVRDFIARYGYWKGNRLVFFFSGHGYTRGTKGFFVPVDAPDPNVDLVGFVRLAIPMDQVMTWAREIEAKHALFAFDSCFSGTLFKARALPTPTEALIRDSTSRPVRQFLTAGDAGEEVPAKSIFTPLFIRALEGKADVNGDGYVTGAEIGLYIRQTMPHYDPALTPQYGKIRDPALDEGDFVFQLTALPPPPPPVEPPVSVAEVQRLLAARGYDPGPVDGILGGATRAAIGRFQRDHGLAATGEPSAELVANLGAPPPRTTAPPRAEPAVGVYPGQTFKDCDVCPEMVVVPAGSFTMGSPADEKDRNGDEGPQHRVTFARPFAVGIYEVTRREFEAFVEATGRGAGDGCYAYDGKEWKMDAARNWRSPGFEQGRDHPVVCVSWGDAKAYAEWLSSKTGKNYRLLTEAEWEYVARGGTPTARYWGDDSNVDQGCAYANVADQVGAERYGLSKEKTNTFQCRDGYAATAPVGKFRSNEFGLKDALGNVWEWVADCYQGDAYKTHEDYPVMVGSWQDSCDRVLRGGSWYDGPRRLRSAHRIRDEPVSRYYNVGFRVARTL